MIGSVEVCDARIADTGAAQALRSLKGGTHPIWDLQAAWDTLGEGAFIFRVFETEQQRERSELLDAKRAAKALAESKRA